MQMGWEPDPEEHKDQMPEKSDNDLLELIIQLDQARHDPPSEPSQS